MNESMNQSVNHKAVYRTAPATPGLLIRVKLKRYEALQASAPTLVSQR